MSVRTKVLGLVDVIMRVPPLLVIDEILKISMGLPGSGYTDSADPGAVASTAARNNTTDAFDGSAAADIMDALSTDPDFYHFLSLTTLKFIICLFGKLESRRWLLFRSAQLRDPVRKLAQPFDSAQERKQNAHNLNATLVRWEMSNRDLETGVRQWRE